MASSLPTMPERSTPKAMSSRLMTMKFMQRGAALASSASDAGSPTTPRTDDEGSASKRRKLASTPNTPNTPVTPLYDQKAIQAAMEEEDKKRKAAVERRAAELGDSHWVLGNVPTSSKTAPQLSLNVVQVGFSQIDSSATLGEDTDSPGVVPPAAARFRQFNMNKSKTRPTKKNDNGDSPSPNEDNAEGISSPTQDSGRGRQNSTSEEARKRSDKKIATKKEHDRRKSQDLARERRKKEMNLNKMTSISSSGPRQQSPKLICRNCGNAGHKACPKRTAH